MLSTRHRIIFAFPNPGIQAPGSTKPPASLPHFQATSLCRSHFFLYSLLFPFKYHMKSSNVMHNPCFSLQAACSDAQNALVDPSPSSPCGVFSQEFFGPIALEIHGRVVAGSSSACGPGLRQWAQKPEWHVALPQAFCGWQTRDSLQVSAAASCVRASAVKISLTQLLQSVVPVGAVQYRFLTAPSLLFTFICPPPSPTTVLVSQPFGPNFSISFHRLWLTSCAFLYA